MTTQAQFSAIGSVLGVTGEMQIRVGGGPMSLRLAPYSGINVNTVWEAISQELQSLVGFGLPSLNGPWAKLLLGDSSDPFIVTPSLWIAPAGVTQQYSASVQLEFNRPITIGGKWQVGPITIEMEPTYVVEALVFSYDTAAGGLDMKAKVINRTTSVPTSPDQRRLLGSGSPAGTKSQMVTFPFPVPAQQPAAGKLFTFHYIGIGQRVGPNPVVNSSDPMLAIFEQLETQLVGDDPAEVLTTLANNFYHPDRGWFVGLDVELRGFRIMLLFNDPAMYGLRISVAMTPVTPFSGFLFEILYQKLSPNLGVYFGALTLPYFMRRIVINGVILILPGFSIWIYTNGDFRVNVGWPLGDASIAVQVGPLVGAGGFYFAKLRSADNPGVQPTVDYNPILLFGIGVMVYIKQGFNASIFSASINVSLSATLQGLLAWKSGGANALTRLPDHYWFAGTASLSVLIEGTVDFAIIKASVTISFQAFLGLALETGYGTLVSVSASVSVRVSIKVIFFTIHLSFSTSVSTQFVVTGGTPASVNGPLDPNLQGFVQPSFDQLLREEMMARVDSVIALLSAKPPKASTRLQAAARAAVSPQVIDVMFALQPTAIYASGGSGQFAVIASLFIEAPSPGQSPSTGTPFELLIVSIVDWLLSLTLPGPLLSTRLNEIVLMLGSGSEPPMGDWASWRTSLDSFLGTLTFSIADIDTTSSQQQTAAVLPMLDVLRLTYVDDHGSTQNIDFDTYNPVPPDYPTQLNEYYRDLGWVGTNPQSQADMLKLATQLRNSFAAYIQADYFLMQARNAASSLYTAALAYEKQQHDQLFEQTKRMYGDPHRSWDLVELTAAHVAQVTGDEELAVILAAFDYASAAGMGSRYLLNGLQLPVPDSTPVTTLPMNVQTGQQYGIAAGATVASGTLSISPTSGAPPGSIIFPNASPAEATCTLTLPSTVPPMPSPEWNGATGSPSVPVNGTINVTALPGVTPAPLYFATKNQIAWNAAGANNCILPLPQPLQTIVTMSAGGPPLHVSVSPTEPPTSNNPALNSPQAPPLPAIPGLLIRVAISQVPSSYASNVVGGSPSGGGSGSPAGGVATQFLPYIYAVSGADEATRDLIYNALQSDLSDASISLLYTTVTNASPKASPIGSPAGPSGLQSEELAETVLLAKTNLSTLNQVPGAGAIMAKRFAFAVNLGDDAAAITDVKGFLRLLWEVSVVNAPGFFLFYNTINGEDLPAELFAQPGTPGGNPTQFDFFVQFAPKPANVVPLSAAANCVVLDQPGPSGSVYLEVLNNDGSPKLQYAPTYAAGSIGFSLLWNRPPEPSPADPVPVNDLYTLVQYAVIGTGGYTPSVWSLPVGPSENNGPFAALASPTDWTFVGTIGISHFFGSQPANRYSIIDRPADLGLRVVDVYGDALPGAVERTFLPLYQDPLLTVAQWPGVLWSWRIIPGSASAATLVINFTFDPDSVVPPESPDSGTDSLRQQWTLLLARYQLIIDQLTDPNTTVTITSTLTNGPIVDSATITKQLTELASRIATNIADALLSSPVVVEGVDTDVNLPISFAAIRALTEDIISVQFKIGSQRNPELVDPVARTGMPAATSVSYSLPPQVQTSSSPSASPSIQFAIDFESAFENFDGEQGMLKLAQRAGVQDGQDAPKVEAFWAVRWSPPAGISVEFDPNQVFFALAPLNNTPMSGTFGGRTWTGVDLDVWARQFLGAVDNFLLPQSAVSVAILDIVNGTSWYDSIITTKQKLAATIVKGVELLFTNQSESGDLAGAQARLEQALLSTLGSAYTVSSIVQIGAAVTLNGVPSPITSPARAPRLYGTVAPLATSSPVGSRQYTLTPGELELIPGQNWMTTLLTVTNPSTAKSISLPLDYQVSYLQHDFQVEEAYLDYIPSSWLKFTLPAAPPLQMPISADATLPVPLLFIPPSPSLGGQQAYGSPLGSGGSPGNIGEEIADALQWNYAFNITSSGSAQDTVYFDITYNQTPTELQMLRAGAGLQGALENLADKLATFLIWYEAASPSFNIIIREAFPNMPGSPPATSPGTAQELIETFCTLAANVQTAWDAIFAGFTEAFAKPATIIDHFAAATSNSDSSRMTLSGRADDGSNPRYWPAMNGTSYSSATATLQDGWWVQPATFKQSATLDVIVPDLKIAERQSATTTSKIVRNADLIQGLITNEDFIYRTDPVSFTSSVVPLIHRTALALLQPDTSLTQTLIDILDPIANTGAGLATTLRVAAIFSFALASDAPTSSIRTNEAILLADALKIDGSPAVESIATWLAAGIAAWYTQATRPTSGAILSLAVTLFGTLGTQQLPLVQIDSVPVDVSGVSSGWWTT